MTNVNLKLDDKAYQLSVSNKGTYKKLVAFYKSLKGVKQDNSGYLIISDPYLFLASLLQANQDKEILGFLDLNYLNEKLDNYLKSSPDNIDGILDEMNNLNNMAVLYAKSIIESFMESYSNIRIKELN